MNPALCSLSSRFTGRATAGVIRKAEPLQLVAGQNVKAGQLAILLVLKSSQLGNDNEFQLDRGENSQ
jgi:hypothetical protein